jgi:glycosyltransferase involved in cell wall biosynthesis
VWIHFDVDLSRPGSFTWITSELAQALLECGHRVSLRPGALSDSLSESTRALLAPLATASPTTAVVVGWNHFHDTPSLDRQLELFAINYRFRGSDPAAFDPWMRRIADGKSVLLAISEYCRQVLLDAHVPAARCAVLPLGYTPEAAWVATRAHVPANRAIRLLAVTNAHDVARYGTDLLLDAYARAFRPADDVALVLRDYGAYNADVDRRVHALKAAGYEVLYFARFLDKEDVIRFYRGCDVFVAPFRGEGFGVKILDALACGLPVIAPHYGGPADYLSASNSVPVAHREVPVGDCLDRRSLALGNDPTWCEVDVDDLAAKLVSTCRNLPTARRRALAGRQAVLDQFDWHRIAGQLVTLAGQCIPTR